MRYRSANISHFCTYRLLSTMMISIVFTTSAASYNSKQGIWRHVTLNVGTHV